jgi:hypothetical protein
MNIKPGPNAEPLTPDRGRRHNIRKSMTAKLAKG